MGSPFTTNNISGYNANPPPNDASETTDNTVDWDTHINKIGDPIKNYASANFGNVTTAFGRVIGGAGITSVATSYTILASDQGKLINVSGGSGVTITTPDATIVEAPFVFGVVNTSSNSVTLDGSGSQTVNGSATISIAPGAAGQFETDGANWYSYAAPYPNTASIFLRAQSFEGTVADGHVVYWDDVNSRWAKAQAGTTTSSGTGIADVTNGFVYGPGLVELTFDQGALTEGVDLYLSSTAGEVTSTKSPGVLKVGRALSATKLWFQPQDGIAGAPVLIEKQTASTSASLNFLTGIGSTYDEYYFKLDRVSPDTDDSELYMRVSDDGSTWEADAGDYQYAYATVTGGAVADKSSTSDTQIVLTGTTAGNAIGNDVGESGFSGRIDFFSPSASDPHTFLVQGAYMRAAGSPFSISGMAIESVGSPIVGVQFLMSAGNIASGTISLYGVTK